MGSIPHLTMRVQFPCRLVPSGRDAFHSPSSHPVVGWCFWVGVCCVSCLGQGRPTHHNHPAFLVSVLLNKRLFSSYSTFYPTTVKEKAFPLDWFQFLPPWNRPPAWPVLPSRYQHALPSQVLWFCTYSPTPPQTTTDGRKGTYTLYDFMDIEQFFPVFLSYYS